MKRISSCILRAFLGAYALCIDFHAPLIREHYKEITDYFTASVYELLGTYRFSFLLMWFVTTFALLFLSAKTESLSKSTVSKKEAAAFSVLSVFFGITYTIGSYFNQAGFNGLTGSFVNILKVLLCITGFALLIRPVLAYLKSLYFSSSFTSDHPSGFWGKNAFFRSFALLFVIYLPFLLLSYPGNLCYDVIGQISQVQTGEFTTHHPLVHTLLAGGMVSLGEKVFNNPGIGLFLYILMQSLLLIATFSASIAFLAKRNVKASLLWVMFLLYCLTPIYTNLSTTALKDVPFTAFVLLYLVYYAFILSGPEVIAKPSVHISFVLIQLGVIFMRNNGLPLVILSGLGAVICLLVRKEKGKTILLSVCGFLAESILVSRIVLFALGSLLSASSGSRGEILSLPFQQTAYYLIECKDSVSESELQAIEAVLGDADAIRENYDPLIADPVKALYKKDSTAADLISYVGAYSKGALRHPVVYAKAFLIHTYGWFSPAVTNEIRYEADSGFITGSDAVSVREKILIFYYRFANRFSLLGALENIGAATWCLFFLTLALLFRKKQAAITTLPLWICLLICMASPCFFNHPRYALPILAGMPFLIIYSKISPVKTAGKELSEGKES